MSMQSTVYLRITVSLHMVIQFTNSLGENMDFVSAATHPLHGETSSLFKILK